MALQEVAVQTDEPLAAALASGGGGQDERAAAVRVRRLVAGLGAELEPTFPGGTGELATHFHFFVDAGPGVGGVADELQQVPGVLGAYLKPTDALP